jgi:hypothetical protein
MIVMFLLISEQDMLPRHIAEALVEGKKIEPIIKDNDHPVTIFFSDIVSEFLISCRM